MFDDQYKRFNHIKSGGARRCGHKTEFWNLRFGRFPRPRNGAWRRLRVARRRTDGKQRPAAQQESTAGQFRASYLLLSVALRCEPEHIHGRVFAVHVACPTTC